jgi:hypothetical protein
MLLYYHVYGFSVTKIRGSSSDDWIYWHFGYTLSLSLSLLITINTALSLIYTIYGSPLRRQ